MIVRAIRLLAAMALLVAAIAFAIGFLENVWAASFHDPHFNAYIRRAYVCALICLVSFLGSAASALWGNLSQIRRRLRNLTDPASRGGASQP